MTPTNFDVDILKKKSFYKLPSSALLGNALFAHLVKFLYNSSKENGIVLCTRTFKVRTSKTFVRQVATHTYMRTESNVTNNKKIRLSIFEGWVTETGCETRSRIRKSNHSSCNMATIQARW